VVGVVCECGVVGLWVCCCERHFHFEYGKVCVFFVSVLGM